MILFPTLSFEQIEKWVKDGGQNIPLWLVMAEAET